MICSTGYFSSSGELSLITARFLSHKNSNKFQIKSTGNNQQNCKSKDCSLESSKEKIMIEVDKTWLQKVSWALLFPTLINRRDSKADQIMRLYNTQ